jgi:hypothetical protein
MLRKIGIIITSEPTKTTRSGWSARGAIEMVSEHERKP